MWSFLELEGSVYLEWVMVGDGICLSCMCDPIWALPTPWIVLAIELDRGMSNLVSSSET